MQYLNHLWGNQVPEVIQNVRFAVTTMGSAVMGALMGSEIAEDSIEDEINYTNEL